MAVTAFVVGAIGVLALATWMAAASESSGQPAPWRGDLGLALIVTGSIAVVAGLVWMLAIGTFTSGDLGYVRSTSRARRVAATRAIRHGQMVAPQEVELTSAIARTTARQRAMSPLWLGILANTIGVLLLGSGAQPLELIAVALIAVGTAANIPIVFAIARARRWLDEAHHQR